MKDMRKWPIGEKVQKLEQQRILELEELKKHLDLLKSSYINNPPGFEFQAERLAYETKINQLKSRISALESTLRENNSKQDSILREYENKNQELKTKIRSFESSKENELVGLKEMNERLKGQFEVKKEKRGTFFIFSLFFSRKQEKNSREAKMKAEDWN
jgi:chromosome segregation ATPase